METRVTLKDGTDVLIRPMNEHDLDRSYAFFQSLPDEDRLFLRVDVSQRENVEKRIEWMEAGMVKRLVALDKDEIIADGSLELKGHGWKEHTGELRLIVSRDFQRKGLGMLMARELYSLGAAEKVDEIVVKMMGPQTAAKAIFKRLGFREKAMLPEYVRDLHGNKQDLVVMWCDLESLWKEIEDRFAMNDWRRAR